MSNPFQSSHGLGGRSSPTSPIPVSPWAIAPKLIPHMGVNTKGSPHLPRSVGV